MITIRFKDFTDGESSILVRANLPLQEIQDIIEDFLSIVGDQLSDESAYNASRRFNAFMRRIGYSTETNSKLQTSEVILVDLPSANIYGLGGGEFVSLPESGEKPLTDAVLADKEVSAEEALEIGNSIGVDWDNFDLEEFRKGISVEREHSDVVGDAVSFARIALDHLREKPDYYSALERMEATW